MNRTTTDELDRLDEALSGNRLLSTFPQEARALIEPFGTIVTLDAGQILHPRGSDVTDTYFPFGTAMVSLVVELPGGRSIEVASIGHEGAVGGIVSCGNAPAFSRAQVLVGGPALQVPVEAIEDAKMRSGHIRNIFCRFADFSSRRSCSRWLATAPLDRAARGSLAAHRRRTAPAPGLSSLNRPSPACSEFSGPPSTRSSGSSRTRGW
jgi:hypothetical protein